MEFEFIEKEPKNEVNTCTYHFQLVDFLVSENNKITFRKFEFPEESLMHCWLSLKQVMSSSCRSAGSAMVVDVNSGVWAENLKMFPKKIGEYDVKTECFSKGLDLFFESGQCSRN